MAGKIEFSQEIVKRIADQTKECIVFLSLGKDSLAVLDLVYPHFDRIVCIFMYFVKDLDHIDRWAKWAQYKYPKIEFEQIPHWNLSYILRAGYFCIPNPSVKKMTLSGAVKAARQRHGIYYCFLGMKKADGMNRCLMLKGCKDNFYENKGLVYPVAEWTQKDIITYLRQKQIPSPIRYTTKSSGGGVACDLPTFLYLQENYPQDLEKIYQVFPFSRKILFEYNYKQKQENQSQES